MTAVDSATFVLQAWLPEYAALVNAAGSGSAFPAVVELGGVDLATVGPAISAFLAADPSYAGLEGDERDELQAGVEAGQAAVVVPAGVRLGAGEQDAGHPGSARRVVLRCFDGSGALMALGDVAALLGSLGGEPVVGHPLLAALAGPFLPAVVSPEGGFRIRLRGSGFAPAASVTVAGQAASDVWVADDGATAWFTAPPGAVGDADVAVDGVVAGTLARVSDAAAGAHAAMQSLIVSIEEVRARAATQVAAGTFDAVAAVALRQRLALAEMAAGELQLQRLAALGLPAVPAEVAAAVSGYEAQLEAVRLAAVEELAVS